MFRIIAGCIAFAFLSLAAGAAEQYPGQFAQVKPEIKEFFKNYNYPNPGRPDHPGFNCCTESDCHILTSDLWTIKDGHYWVLAQKRIFVDDKQVVTDERWIEVPKEREITKYGNPTNGAIACYQWYGNSPSFYCFTPGDLF